MNDFQQIVAQCYEELHGQFKALILSRFSGMSADDVEDLYHETFMAIYDNLHKGRVAEDTKWKAYILSIGLNLANNLSKGQKRMVPMETPDDDDGHPVERFANLPSLESLVEEMTGELEERERLITKLNEMISEMKDPCSTLLRDFYYNDLSLAEIRDEMGYASIEVVKTKRYKCFDRLKRRVMEAFGQDM